MTAAVYHIDHATWWCTDGGAGAQAQVQNWREQRRVNPSLPAGHLSGHQCVLNFELLVRTK